MNEKIVLRTYRPGDPSRVCYFQYKLYEKQYHFNGLYEKEMLGGMAELYDDPKGSQMCPLFSDRSRHSKIVRTSFSLPTTKPPALMVSWLSLIHI